MRRQRISFEDMININKGQIKRDSKTLEKIDKKVDSKFLQQEKVNA